MQINHNIRAMVTQHALYQNNNAMSKSLEKLSTGLRINRAQDDAAGLAMSEQMRTQIRALGKAKQNSQDGQAALQIAEGGLQEITNLLQRQRELAIQAANDTLTSTERHYLDEEFQELSKEVGRISLTTDYNGKNMLNWIDDPNLSFGAATTKGPNANKAASYTLHVGANYSHGAASKWGNELNVTYSAMACKVSTDGNWDIIVGGVTYIAGGKAVLGLTLQNSATAAIDALDSSIKSISGARAKIGTFINRLDYTINNIANLEFNTQDAETRIRDTDFGKETTNFTRNQILVQSATSMLAQANSLPQSVLGLLG